MSTGALFKVIDESYESDIIYVFKHFDGNPYDVVEVFENAFNFAWELPRFEADEFAAAIIAGNKDGSGDFRIATRKISVEFTYEVKMVNDKLIISVSQGDTIIFNGSFEEFKKWAKEED